jgi:GntR family transcriptional repressor for pyruvate dehydrogenase complex
VNQNPQNGLQKIQQNIPLSKKVEEQLKNAILKNVYAPGDRLPSELELVEIFGVSRTAIREAIRTLAGQGLVSINGRSGVYVNEMDMTHVVTPLSLLLEQKCGEASHLYLKQVRKFIEPEIARIAALKRSDADVSFLANNFKKMKELRDHPDQMIAVDIQFHKRLAGATGNPIIPIIMEPIYELLPKFISQNFKLSNAPDKSLEQHAHIFTAIRDQNDKNAFHAMSDHMQTAEEHVLEYYKKIGFDAF